VESILSRETVANASERNRYLTQRTIIHVHGAAPGDPAGIETERIAPINVVVHKRGQQVVRNRDGMEVTGEMQIDVFHRQNLRIAAAGRAALPTKAWAQARFAQADDRLLSNTVQCVAKPHGRCSFTLAGGGWCHSG